MLTKPPASSTQANPGFPTSEGSVLAGSGEQEPCFSPGLHGTSPAPPRSRPITRILLLIASLLLTLCVLELAVRLLARLTSEDRVMTPDAVLGWKLLPNALTFHRRDSQPYHVVVNAKGLRDRERPYDKPPGTFRIVVIGDSVVFGSGGVEMPQRFTELLEQATQHVEVINMGVPGYGTDQELLYLKTEGLKYHPDLVLFCVFFNDFNESFEPINAWNGRPKGYFSLQGDDLVFHPPSFSTFYLLSQHSYLLGLADMGLMKVSQAYRKRHHRQGMVLDPQTRIKVFQRMFASVAELCRQNDIRVMFVYLPYPAQKGPLPMQKLMESAAADHQVPVLDLTDTLAAAHAVKPAYFPGDVHFNQYGHRVVAGALYRGLAGSGGLEPRLLKDKVEDSNADIGSPQ